MKILILCTGNSCRSQMAHGFLQSFEPLLEVFSTGTKPAEKVNPNAIVVKGFGGDVISEFRCVRDEIKNQFEDFYNKELKQQ